MIKITFENKNELNEIYFHDCCFYDYSYSYGERTITLNCDNDWLKREYQIRFNNVVYLEMIGCCFWGENNCYINWAGYSPCEDIVQKLFLLQEKNDIRFVERNPTLQPEKSKWNSGISYVPMLFEFMSGDRLVIFSEEIQIDIQEW